MEHLNTQSDVFGMVVQNAIQLSRRGSSYDGLLDELYSDECLPSVSFPSYVICFIEVATFMLKLFSRG